MSIFSSIGKSLSKSFKSFTSGFKSNPIGSILGMSGLPQSTSQMFPLGEWMQHGFKDLGENVSDIYDIYSGRDIALKNYEEQKRQFDLQNSLNERQFQYQQELNKLQNQREDTAYQRKVADMTAAGFNPILAASGSGSPSTLGVSPALHTAPAPQMENTSGALRETAGLMSKLVMEAISMKKDFAMKDAQIKLFQAEKDKVDAEAAGIKTENKYKDEYYGERNRSMKLANQATESKLPLELQKLTKDIELKDQELVLKNLQEEADRLRISGLEKDNLYKDLQNDYAFKNLTKVEQEIEINALLIARKTMENNEYDYAVKFYHDRFFGLPYDGKSAPSVETLTYMAIRQGLDVIDGKTPTPKPPKPKPPRKFTKAELKELLKRPSGSNMLWTRRMNETGDYGARRNF